ncbi:capsular associated protein [Mycena leptocephala]|nr:capsular associated protein [Mycena leptocephala]
MNSKSRNTGVVGQLRRLPTPVALLIGVLCGLLFSRLLPWSTSTATWRGYTILPTLDQRQRIFHLLTSLSPHYTKECTRNTQTQPLYQKQATERYARSLATRPRGSVEPDYGAGSTRRDIVSSEHKYFFAINLYNSFDIIPDLFATLFRVAAILGYHNVYVSIYENGSTDQTKALLRIFDALTRSVGMRITIRTSTRTRGAFNHRIEYLAEVRNAAFVPLHELRDAENEFFDTILIWQSRNNNAGITCAADYMYHDEIGSPVFYDNWKHLPIQVQSCWNGIAVLDPAPFYLPPHVRFRMARIADGECSASECSLICNDYWEAGYGRIMMVPRVKLAYDHRVFDIIHPGRRNLTAIRGYVRMGGLPDDPRTDPQDRSWFGPHDRLFTEEESEPLEFNHGPEQVWCWGWDGAGDLEGPDVDPIWERMSNKSTVADAVVVKHVRSLP